MNTKAILVTVVSLKPGLEELLIQDLALLVEATREFPGCLAFDLYRLLTKRDTLVLQETWLTPEAHQAYTISPLKGELTTLFAPALADPIQAWQVEEVCCFLSEP